MENKRENTYDIIIDDGSKVYNIKNKSGEMLGKFSFRPSDTNIIHRYEEVVDYFNNLTVSEDDQGAMNNIEKMTVEKISYLINADAENSFFKILGPFSVLASGELFFENVINAIGKTIETEMRVRTKRMNNRMNRYMQKYKK